MGIFWHPFSSCMYTELGNQIRNNQQRSHRDHRIQSNHPSALLPWGGKKLQLAVNVMRQRLTFSHKALGLVSQRQLL